MDSWLSLSNYNFGIERIRLVLKLSISFPLLLRERNIAFTTWISLVLYFICDLSLPKLPEQIYFFL